MLAFVAIFGLIAIGGAWLTLRGFFPKRQGETPFCRRCRYNLTGIDLQSPEARCPECGALLSSKKALLYGQRHIRTRRLALGVIILLAGLTPLGALAVGTARKVDWYAYKPTRWILQDLQADDERLSRRAWNEITRRLQAGQLSPEHKHQLIEAALAEEVRPARRDIIGEAAMTILLRLYRVAQLSADQEQRFLANLFRFSIAVQPCESHGPPLYEVIISAESPGPRYWPYLELEMGESRISGDLDRRIHGGKRMMGNTRPGVPLDLGILVEFARAGSFNISQDYSWRIRDTVTDREARSIDPADVIYESQGTLETQLQLTTTTPDMLVVRSDPELDAAVAAVLKLSAFHFYKTEGTAGGVKRSLIAHMQIGGERPTGLVFEVSGVLPDREIQFAPLVIGEGGGGAWTRVIGTALDPQIEACPDQITLVFRSSRQLALQTPGITQLWDGELVFEAVPILQEEPGAASQPAVLYSPVVRRAAAPVEAP